MSNSKNQQLSYWKTVEESLRSKDLPNLGLSKRDLYTYTSCILFHLMICSDLLGMENDSLILRDFGRTYRLTKPAESARTFKEASSLLQRGTFSSYDGFKHHLECAGCTNVAGLLNPVADSIESFALLKGAYQFYECYQFLTFASRLSLKDIDLMDQSISDYLKIERDLKLVTPLPSLTSMLNQIIIEVMKGFSFEDFQPKHGNGSVSRCREKSLAWKYSDGASDTALRLFEGRIGNFRLEDKPLDRACEVVFVPKSALTWRTISMEPSTLMFYQQGIWDRLDRHLSSHAFFLRHVAIHDQSMNREAAKEGSKTGKYCTIDLSAASDCVSWKLVKAIFAHTPLLMAFYATRSKEAILPDGSRIALEKFAPMGSAICFPVETIIFTAICECCRRVLGDPCTEFFVYGDDIIAPDSWYPYLVKMLQNLGFKVNETKSFHGYPLFRESCGCDCFEGTDVTPLRLSRRFRYVKPTTLANCHDVIESYVDLANLADQYGFTTLRRWLISELNHLPKDLAVLYSYDKKHLFSTQATNFHLYRDPVNSWRYQNDYVFHGQTDTRRAPSLIDKEKLEEYRYYEWLRQTRFREKLTLENVCTADVRPTYSLWGVGSSVLPNVM